MLELETATMQKSQRMGSNGVRKDPLDSTVIHCLYLIFLHFYVYIHDSLAARWRKASDGYRGLQKEVDAACKLRRKGLA